MTAIADAPRSPSRTSPMEMSHDNAFRRVARALLADADTGQIRFSLCGAGSFWGKQDPPLSPVTETQRTPPTLRAGRIRRVHRALLCEHRLDALSRICLRDALRIV